MYDIAIGCVAGLIISSVVTVIILGLLKSSHDDECNENNSVDVYDVK